MQTDLVKTLVTIAAYILSQANGGTQPLPSGGPSGPRAVVGYYSEYYPGERAPYASLRANRGTLTGIAPFAYYLDGQGNLSGTRPTEAFMTAKSSGLKVLALIHNFSRGNGFESWTAHGLLSKEKARGRAVANLLSLMRRRGYDGVNIDLENVPARDRENYTAFLRELAGVMRGAGYMVTASIPAKVIDERGNDWSGAFDYAAIAPWVDQVMLMTYDENGSLGQAGPVASLPWVEQVIRYARTAIPSRKILVGLAGYGYDWAQGRTGGKTREFPEIQRLVDRLDVNPRWDNVAKVPYIRYNSGGQARVIWYENNWSAAYKLDLVNRYNLGGIALWRLGGEDPHLWSTIREKLG